MKIHYLRIFQGILLSLILTSCSKPAEDLIYGEYLWTQRNEDGSRDFITILQDGTFIQKIGSTEIKGDWKEITDYGDYQLWAHQVGDDWEPTLLLFLFPDGREQFFFLDTPWDEHGDCRSTFRQRELTPIDTIDTRIVGQHGMNLFGKQVDKTNKDFPGCPVEEISRVYNCIITDGDEREIGTAQIDVNYEGLNGVGYWNYSAQWEPQYRMLPTRGAGKIEKDTLYDSKLGIFALGYIRIDTLCCEHIVYLQVGNSIQSFR